MKHEKKKAPVSSKLMILIFLLFLVFFSLGSFLYKNKSFSENENRYLQALPRLSADDLVSGVFEKNMDAYISDRLLGREFLIGAKSDLLKALGIREANGVYFCDGGYYMEKKTSKDVDAAIYENNIAALQKFFQKLNENGIDAEKLSFLPVPTATAILRDKLPANAPYFDEFEVLHAAQEKLQNFRVIDTTDEVSGVQDPFYRTDHHWTTGSAYAAYQKWCEETGRAAHDRSFYNIVTASESFRGTLYSKVLSRNAPYDQIRFYIPKEPVSPQILCDGQQMNFTNGFYAEDFLKQKDKYAAFLGGNFGEVRISNGDGAGKGGNILILKDSYANCFVPFLYGYFDNIYLLDLRYYNGDILKYAEEHGITEVLALYNISSFVSDKTVGKVGGK